ncbi:MAG: hypothetical protein SVW02_00250 [Candidatus Nanohaloarchaea archaeon]|nr:hypothetical protein [Candidatus Nanohaloarchaea archaeon]
MVLDRVKARFQGPLEVDELADAHDLFAEEKAAAIDAAEEELEQIQAEVDDALDELDERLQALEGYEDVEGRTAVEDVADNIVSDRRRMVAQFSVPDEPDELHAELDAFVDSFKEMKHKETEVLKLMGDDKKPVFDALDRVKELRDRAASFIDGEHQVLERHRTLQEQVQELQRLRERKEELEEELDGFDLAARREAVEEVEEQLDELHGSEAWEDYEELRDELDQAKEERQDVRSTIETAMNRMDRGLKKLLYEAGHGDVSIGTGKEVLQDVRDGNVDAVLDRDPGIVEDAVEAATEALPDDLLGERQRDKFLDAADTLSDLASYADRLAELDDRVQALEEQVESHEAPQRENELSADLDDRGRELEEARKEKRKVREELEDVEDEIEQVEERIREELDAAFHRDVVTG